MTSKGRFSAAASETGAHCTLRPLEENRRKTLSTLLELASETSPNMCWDDTHAMALLRAQATAEELRELGASEELIALIFSEQHAP